MTPNARTKQYEQRLQAALHQAINHPNWDAWSRFYWDAKVWAMETVDAMGWNHPFAVRNFCYCTAALSPLKPWDQNQLLAEQALWRYLEYGNLDALPVMQSRRVAAQLALTHGHVSGTKVEPFARALHGDQRAAVIDRHMMAMVGTDALHHVPLIAEALTRVTDSWRAQEWLPWTHNVTAVQAGLWGWWRDGKNLKDYTKEATP